MNYILIFLLALLCVPYLMTLTDVEEGREDRAISAVIIGVLTWAAVVVWGTLQ